MSMDYFFNENQSQAVQMKTSCEGSYFFLHVSL